MVNLTEEKVREIAREEVKKASTVDVNQVAKELFKLQQHTSRR